MSAAIGYEAICRRCGETFNPADESDLMHYERVDGQPCNGLGELLGSWGAPRPRLRERVGTGCACGAITDWLTDASDPIGSHGVLSCTLLHCQWFAGCDRAAVMTVPHPILGDVPSCARCAVVGR